jgi:nucleotide-binding universal stress UspA family protein
MYDDVLLAVDGSEGSKRAADEAIAQAATHGAALHVVSVVDATTADVGSTGGDVLRALEREQQAAVDEAVERARAADVPTVEASVLSGVPASAIVEYAADRDVDLVVVGTHGRTGIEHVVLGSVAERVVRTADAPVLVVPAAGD